MAERLLIIEDEETLNESLKRVFGREGYEVTAVLSAEAALKTLEEAAFDVIITDIILPGIDGIELLGIVKTRYPDQITIVMTAYATLDTAVGALRAGAYDYVIKPIIHEEIKRIVRNALRERALRAENQLLKKQIEERYDFGKIVGESPAIFSVLDEVKKVSVSRSNVLILGETGTGKELFARAIHYNSPRKEKPFIPINCSAIPENLLESELFGYIKGAFTGATTSKRGLFEEADGGTVFLDEIGDLGLPLQSKLLRVIDDREIRPLGGVQARQVDIRFVAATNRDICRLVAEGTFREDLFYRINVISLTLPPLRDRREDIPVLIRHFTEKYAHEIGKPTLAVDGEAARLLYDYQWPGNVRELQNIVERAVLICEGGDITAAHLPDGLRARDAFVAEAMEQVLSIEEYTKQFIIRHQACHGEQELASMLGITRKALWEKRKKWGLKRK